MRCALPILLLVVTALPALGQEPEPSPPPAVELRRLTLELKGVPLRRALELLCGGAGLEYSVAPDVPNVPVDLSIREVPVRAAVRELVRNAAQQVPGLTLDERSETWAISLRRTPARKLPFRGAASLVALNVKDVPLRQALQRLFKGVDVWCAVDPNVPDTRVTVSITPMTLHSAAWLVAGAASEKGPRLQVRREGANFNVGLAPQGTAPRAPAVDLHLKYVPLRRALKQAGQHTGLRFVIDGSVPDVPITLRLNRLTPDAAVRQVTAVAALRVPRVACSRAGDVVVIYRQPAARVGAWRGVGP